MRIILIIIFIAFFITIKLLYNCVIFEKNLTPHYENTINRRVRRNNSKHDKFFEGIENAISEKKEMKNKLREYLGEHSNEFLNLFVKYGYGEEGKNVVLPSVLELLDTTSKTLREYFSQVPKDNLEEIVKESSKDIFLNFYSALIERVHNPEKLKLVNKTYIKLDKVSSSNFLSVGVDPFIFITEISPNMNELKKGLDNLIIDLAISSKTLSDLVIRKGIVALRPLCKNTDEFIENREILLNIAEGMENKRIDYAEALFATLHSISLLTDDIRQFENTALLTKKLILNLKDDDIKKLKDYPHVEEDTENSWGIFSPIHDLSKPSPGALLFLDLTYSIKRNIDEFNRIIKNAIEIAKKNGDPISYLESFIK